MRNLKPDGFFQLAAMPHYFAKEPARIQGGPGVKNWLHGWNNLCYRTDGNYPGSVRRKMEREAYFEKVRFDHEQYMLHRELGIA